VRARSRARGWALQVLYAWESRGGEAGDVREILTEFLAERRIAAESRDYLTQLVHVAIEQRAPIDEALQGALTNWRLARLSVIDRNILRLAAAEMLFVDDVPGRVSIQEAILLAEKYGTSESPRFVNGVLDALLRRGEEDGAAAGGERRPR
jgi:transcription antitermination factor NusB